MLTPEQREGLLALYDTPEGPGYDRDHARRTAALAVAVARRLGFAEDVLERFETACLLHDVARVGLDKGLFGRIWTLARQEELPTRPKELRDRFGLEPGEEMAYLLRRLSPKLIHAGIPVDARTREQVRMRLDVKARQAEMLRRFATRLRDLQVAVEPWMEQVTLHYYYPEELAQAPGWVRSLGATLVACEQFEAHNNRERGRDYYDRQQESLEETFAYLNELVGSGAIGREHYRALAELVLEGSLNPILKEARGLPVAAPLPTADRAFLEQLRQDAGSGSL